MATKKNAAAVQPTTIGNLHERAVLVRCVEHTWMGGTIDRKASKEITDSKGAKADVGHFWLRLVPKAAIRPIANAGNAVKHFYRRNTLPWLDGDVRMLPASELDTFLKELRKLIADRAKEEQKFYQSYNSWRDDARKSHGALFDESKYPALETLKGKFGFDVDVLPVPNVQDWRVNLADDQVAELRKKVAQRFIEAQQAAMRELCESLFELVEHAHNRLSDPEATFRNSLVDNIKKQLEIVARLNVTGDKTLDDLRKEVSAKLAAHKPDELRTDPDKRKKAANDARDIMKKMSAYMGTSKK